MTTHSIETGERTPGPYAVPALPGLLATLTSVRALLLAAMVLAAVQGGVIVRYLAGLEGVVKTDGEVATGDFLVFYTGGRMVLEGHGAELYDPAAQRRAQDGVTGPGYRYHHWFVNPPLLALLLAPLSALPFVQAFYLHDLAMLAAMAAALALLRPHLPALGKDRLHWWTTVLLVMTFHPIARTVFGGQNTPLTFLLLAGAYACFRRGRPLTAGVLLGLLSYKPQYLLVLGPALVLRRSWTALAGAGAAAAVHYLLGALVCGADWPLRMAGFLSHYRLTEAQTNFHLHIALLPVLRHALAPPWDVLVAAPAIAAILILALAAALRCSDADPRFGAVWALLVCATLLVSPHTQYYDAGLVALAVVLGLDFLAGSGAALPAGLRLVLLAGYLAYPVYALVAWLGFQPLVLWPLAGFLWSFRLSRGKPLHA